MSSQWCAGVQTCYSFSSMGSIIAPWKGGSLPSTQQHLSRLPRHTAAPPEKRSPRLRDGGGTCATWAEPHHALPGMQLCDTVKKSLALVASAVALNPASKLPTDWSVPVWGLRVLTWAFTTWPLSIIQPPSPSRLENKDNSDSGPSLLQHSKTHTHLGTGSADREDGRDGFVSAQIIGHNLIPLLSSKAWAPTRCSGGTGLCPVLLPG